MERDGGRMNFTLTQACSLVKRLDCQMYTALSDALRDYVCDRANEDTIRKAMVPIMDAYPAAVYQRFVDVYLILKGDKSGRS